MVTEIAEEEMMDCLVDDTSAFVLELALSRSEILTRLHANWSYHGL